MRAGKGLYLVRFHDNEVTYIQSLYYRSLNPFVTSDTIHCVTFILWCYFPERVGEGEVCGCDPEGDSKWLYHTYTHTHTYSCTHANYTYTHTQLHVHIRTHAHTHMCKQVHAWKFVETDNSSNFSPVLLFIWMLYFSTSTATLCGTSLIEPLQWYTGLTVSLQVATLLGHRLTTSVDHRLTAGSHITRSPSHCR